MRFLFIIIIAFTVFAGQPLAQKIHTETIEYKQDTTILEGYLAYDQTLQGPRPGIIIVHEWNGLGDYVKMRAEQLAKMGYVAFAIDIYGKGVRPKTQEESAAQATYYRNNRPLMRARAQAGLDLLSKNRLVDPTRIAAIGYCFGGGVVLELARSGADVAGIVSFHGNLDTPNTDDAKNIKGKVLVCHGGSDPYVTRDKVEAFQDEMTKAGVDWRMVMYGGAVHGFTNSANGTDPSKGLAYNKDADMRSWDEMKRFFDEIFK
jgi:dienelactone hydrolase